MKKHSENFKTSAKSRTWFEIDLKKARNNYNYLHSFLRSKTKMCCVIKANAYGHGAVRMAKLYESLGADYIAVATLDEAIELRHAKIGLPILILGYTPPEYAEILSDSNISQCVFSLPYAKELSHYASKANKPLKIHIKIDTGMGRIGFRYASAGQSELSYAEEACKLPFLFPEGIFTHFSSASEDTKSENVTETQFKYFTKAISLLKKKNVFFDIRHCSNSAGIVKFPNMHLDMVRAGISLYGFSAFDSGYDSSKLEPIGALKTVISQIKQIQPGETIGYGRKYKAKKESIIATLPIGYADGLWRSNSQCGLLVNLLGKSVPIVGSICMDQAMIDVSRVKGAKVGDVVTVYGSDESSSVKKAAEINKTISYEILCAISKRVPRVYINE